MNNYHQKRFFIMAGGTGGHILPALAVAKELEKQGVEIHWLGTPQGLEHELVPAAKIPIHYIQIKGIRGKGFFDLLMAPFRILGATWQSIKIFRKVKPDLVLGFGGFVSGPGGFATWILRKPLVLHEQNSIAGMTNRVLAHLAQKIFQGFPNTFPSHYQAVTVGNPVRKDILELPLPKQRFSEREGPLHLLILGGSQGAATLNEFIPTVLAKLMPDERPIIWHSAGKRSVEKTQAIYAKLNLDAQVVGFIEDMASAYAWADLVICRAGASTIAELTAAGIGSILVPYPYAVDDHQTKNANLLEKAGAAIIIQEKSLTKEGLKELIQNLSYDRPRIETMACKAHALKMTDAAKVIAEYCVQNFA